MKKLFLLLIPVFFLVTSCDLLFDIFLGDGSGSGNTFTQTVEVDESGDVYLVQVNENDSRVEDSLTVYNIKYKNNSYSNCLEINNSIINNNDRPEYVVNDIFLPEIKLIPDNSRTINNNGLLNEEFDNSVLLNTKETFYTSDTMENRNFYCVAFNDFCNIWLCEDDIKDTLLYENKDKLFNNINTLAEKFAKVFEIEESIFGKHQISSNLSIYKPITTTKKIDILIMDISKDAKKNQTGGTFGYFNPSDLYTNVFNSNQMECFYIDSYFLYKYEEYSYSSVIHEYAHLLTYVNKTINKGIQDNNRETWYTEMISMLAEDLLHNVIGINEVASSIGRINYTFAQCYNDGFGNWNSDDNNVTNSYACAYAYGAYIIRNYGGMKLLNEILNNNFYGKESVNNALLKISNIDFNFALENEVKIFFNTQNNSNEEISLNKEIIVDSVKGIQFDKIIFNPKVINNINGIKIGPYGIYIQKIGTDIQSYDIYGSSLLKRFQIIVK